MRAGAVRMVRHLLPGLLLVWLLGGCLPRGVDADPAATADAPGVTGITGTVTGRDGAPARGAYVYAYRNVRSGLRGPADFEAAVGDDGRYLLDLVEGSYHLVARLRPDGGDAGPPRVGDAWALPAKNPVAVGAGRITPVDFVLQTVAQPMVMREGTLTGGDTGFSGTLVDGSGRPLPSTSVPLNPVSPPVSVPSRITIGWATVCSTKSTGVIRPAPTATGFFAGRAQASPTRGGPASPPSGRSRATRW